MVLKCQNVHTGFCFLQEQHRLLADQGRKSKQLKVLFPIFNIYCFSFLALQREVLNDRIKLLKCKCFQ